MKTISIKDIEGIRIGNAQNFTGGTGCTVILSETGMCAGLDVRGGGPASRESELLKPLAAAQSIHAVLLGGGSAFGLDAAGLSHASKTAGLCQGAQPLLSENKTTVAGGRQLGWFHLDFS